MKLSSKVVLSSLVSLTLLTVGCQSTESNSSSGSDSNVETKNSSMSELDKLKASYLRPSEIPAPDSNKITDAGRKALKDFGLAPPPKHNYIVDIDILNKATCPVCGSDNTELQSPFGPTACRSIHYCHECLETFEQFKPL